jgi:hypothetical protein
MTYDGSSWSSVQTAVSGGSYGIGGYEQAIDDSGEILLIYANYSDSPQTYRFSHYNGSWYHRNLTNPATQQFEVSSMPNGFMFGYLEQSTGIINTTRFVDGSFLDYPHKTFKEAPGTQVVKLSNGLYGEVGMMAALPEAFNFFYYNRSSDEFDLYANFTWCGGYGCEKYERCSNDCYTETWCLDGVDNDEDGYYDTDDSDCTDDTDQEVCEFNGHVWFENAHYPGNYSFASDTDGLPPTGLAEVWDNVNITVEVIPSFNTHLKVINYSYILIPEASPDGLMNDSYTFSSGIFRIEWWESFYNLTCDPYHPYGMVGVTSDIGMPPSEFYLAGPLCNGSLYKQTVKDGVPTAEVLSPVVYENDWHHYLIEINLDAVPNSTVDFYLDNALVIDDEQINNFDINLFGIVINNGHVGNEFYFDALDGSWAHDYTVGRNRQPPCCESGDTFWNDTLYCCDGSIQGSPCS